LMWGTFNNRQKLRSALNINLSKRYWCSKCVAGFGKSATLPRNSKERRVLVYQTPKFLEQLVDSRDSEIQSRVQELVQKIESAPSRWEADQVWQYRDRGFHKQRVGKWRILAKFRVVAGVDVCCMHACVERGSSEYEHDFLRDKNFSSIERTFVPEDVEKWVTAHGHKKSSSLPRVLPPNLAPWLDAPEEFVPDHDPNCVTIFESQRWAESIADHQVVNRFESVYELLSGLAEKNDALELRTWSVASNRSIQIRYFRPSSRELFLDSVSVGGKEVVPDSETLPPKNFQAIARRAYPSYLLADQDLWGDIQRGQTSNLSLSPEEVELLRGIGSQTGDGHRLPMFINGRAGSGKSTMLMYSFAALWQRKIVRELAGTPIYITYSPRLLEKARSGVTQLLRSNHQFLIDRDVVESQEYRNSFVRFSSLLREYLSDENLLAFPDEKHVGFFEFKRAFLGRNSKLRRFAGSRRSLSPEMAWYVIRSLIKGSDGQTEFGLERFDELPRKDRAVSRELFDFVYNQIFSTWYQPSLSEDGLWDDQDLVLAALSGEVQGDRDISAVICDEAQDFTRRELRFLIRACSLTRFDLWTRYSAVRLPFVLAGDPLQTISPTGFRWEQFTSAMFEEVEALAGDRTARPQFEELSFNYRSSAEIVHVVNALQQLRSDWLGLTRIEPQRPWSERGGSALPRKFLIGAGITQEQFESLSKDSVIIVPCEESGEIDFVKNDPILKNLYPDASETVPPYNLFSPSSAKGLEFSNVIVYGFGQGMPPRDEVLLRDETDDDALFRLKHFFNNLYVAVTRAESRLAIVDTLLGDENLWRHLNSSEVARRKVNTEFDGLVECLLEGSVEDFESIGDVSPLETAKKLEVAGLDNRIPAQLRQAAGYYRRAGNEEGGRRCEAEALFMEDRFLDGGNAFKALGDFGRSWSAFWMGCHWDALSELGGIWEAKPHLEWIATKLMLGSEIPWEDVELLMTRVTAEFRSPGLPPEAWRSVAERLVVRVSREDLGGVDEDVAGSMKVLAAKGLKDAARLAGSIWFSRGEWHKADEVWGDSSAPSIRESRIARAMVQGLPKGLVHLSSDGFHQDVVRLWEEFGSPRSREWMAEIVTSLRLANPPRIAEAVRAYLELDQLDEAQSQLEKLWSDSSFSKLLDDFLQRAAVLGSVTSIANLLRTRILREGVGTDSIASLGRMVETLIRRIHDVNERPVTSDTSRGSEYKFLFDRCESFKVSVHPLVLGALAEQSGQYVPCLQFYERFVDDDDIETRVAARYRWIHVKRLQVSYEKDHGSEPEYRKKVSELRSKQAKWRLSTLGELPIRPHVIDHLRTRTPGLRGPVEALDFVNDGRWEGLRWERQADRLRLELELEYSLEVWEVDFKNHRVKGRVPPTTKEADVFSFDIGSYQVEVSFGAPRQVKITDSNGNSVWGTA